MNINLHIERLILDGLTIGHGQGSFVKPAIEAELRRLLSAKGLSQNFKSGAAVSSARADVILMTNESSPVDLGHQIARSVYNGIGENK